MRNNNFDILRLLCALLVIVSHSYALLNLHAEEPLLQITHMMILSDIGLCGFFTISGYLILNSLLNSKSILSYLLKRFLRIFPGLLVCLILVVFVCSFFYSGDASYWMQKESYSFVWNNLGLYTIQWDIPNVFTDNPFTTINGSLWTLAHEFTLYLLIIGLFFVRKHHSVIAGLTLVALVLSLTKNIFFANNFANTVYCGLSVNSFSRFSQYFLVGMLMHICREWREKRRQCRDIRMVIGCVCGALMVILTYLHTYIHTMPLVMLCISVIFIMLGEMYWKPVSDRIKYIGDISYGIYIYAFPIQQILIALIPCLNPTGLTLLTIIIVLPIAFISWHLVEKKAIMLKKYL